MKKDFITVTPDTGGGSQQVQVTADANPSFASRETTLNFSASGGGGALKNVKAVQSGTPFNASLFCSLRGKFTKSSSGSQTVSPIMNLPESPTFVEGVLTQSVDVSFKLTSPGGSYDTVSGTFGVQVVFDSSINVTYSLDGGSQSTATPKVIPDSSYSYSKISLSAADYSLGITHRVALDIFSNGVKVITFNFELYF
jgi:hypothetical protein